jgi:hypothetical protein
LLHFVQGPYPLSMLFLGLGCFSCVTKALSS